jgi:two-component system, LytTR family, response regulator
VREEQHLAKHGSADDPLTNDPLTNDRPTKIRTVVVDDEPLARSNLTVLLRLDPEIEIVCECGSGVDAIAAIRHSKPDIVFLDVQMPECDGFDVLELLGQDLPLAVVFVTAYDHYALRAFEAGALDYLLKPFDNPRFGRALARAKERITRDKDLLRDPSGKIQPRTIERIAVKSAGQVVFLKTAEIDWIEAADYYACLHIGPKNHLLRRSMSDLEQELDPAVFCRIHRSTIVNLNRVRGLNLSEDGEYEVRLNSGTRLRLSRRYRKQLQSRLGIRASECP